MTEVTHSLTELLVQLSSILIESGVSLAEAQKYLQVAYLHSAQSKALLGNKRVNQSALAAITGLNRTRVRNLLRERETDDRRYGRISEVIEAWESDPEFCGRSNRPRNLHLRGQAGTFEALAKRYGGDITPLTLLRELQRLKLVRIVDGVVRLTDKGRKAQRTKGLRQLAVAFSRALSPPENPGHATALGIQSVQFMITGLSPKARAIFRRRCAQSMKAFVEDLETAAAAAQSHAAVGRGRKRLSKLSVLLVERQ